MVSFKTTEYTTDRIRRNVFLEKEIIRCAQKMLWIDKKVIIKLLVLDLENIYFFYKRRA